MKRISFLAVFIILTNMLYSQPSGRENFDADWKFHLGDMDGAEHPGFDDRCWRTLDLPHDWSIEGSFKPDNPAGGSGASLPGGIGWYRKSFRISETMGKRCYIMFDGVYQNSTVWINGHRLGQRPFGYATFQYDLTPYMQQGDNIIAVRVDNSLQPNSRWYSGSGIYRHVWLTTTSPIHISPWGTYVTTPRVLAKEASVRVETDITNAGQATANIKLVSTILDHHGKKVGGRTENGRLVAGVQTKVVSQLKIRSPKLWSIEQPVLYKLVKIGRASCSERV